MVASAYVYAAAAAANAAVKTGPTPEREPEPTMCDGCGAPLKPRGMVCDHCRRPRRGAEKSPGYPQDLYDETARRFAVASPPAPFVFSAIPPTPAFEPSYSPAPAPALDFNSGGGGNFSGGGATGD